MSINKINGAVSDTLSKVNGTRNTLLSNMLVPSSSICGSCSPEIANAPMFNSHSIDLDGSADYIDLDAVVGDIDTDAGAVTLWFKINAGAATSQLWKTNQSSSAAQNQIQIYYNSPNDKIVFQQKYNGEAVTWNSTAITPGDDNWHFIAMSWSDLDFIAYLNTEASGVQTLNQLNTPTPFNPGKCMAGRNSAASNLYLDGHLDEIGMWDAELSAAALVAIYNNGKGINLSRDVNDYTNASDLIGYWKMEENTGNTVVDSSGGGETGALNATDLWSTDTI